MRIVHIETFTRNPVSIVRVLDEDGAEGVGQCAPYQADITAAVLHRQVAPHVLGEDAADPPRLAAKVLEAEYKFSGSYLCRALAGVDTALWDLLGRRANRPVTELVGGTPRRIAVYGSSMRRDITPEAEAERLDRLRQDEGYRAFKIRVGRPLGHDEDAWPGRTEAIIPAVRQRLDDETVLLADANGGFSATRATAVGRQLEDWGYGHFEEPCPFAELEATREVAEALTIPVAGGEQDYSLAQWRRMISMHAVDIVQPDIGYVGGFSRALAVARTAADAGLVCTPHVANRSFLTIFTMHLLAAISNAGPFMEHSIEPTPWTDDLFDPATVAVHDGGVPFPGGPGWGVAIDGAWLKGADRRATHLP